MQSPNYKDEALPLIQIAEDNKLTLNPSAIEILRGIPKPIAVVGVAGQYRTGKSYLLNKIILNRNTGFPVGSTTNACTKGIWMWGRPLKGQTKEGKQVNVIVLDSEGLGSIEEGSNHDSRIFALVMLLSSCFIYNSMGSIDENALDCLSLIVDLTKHIQIKCSGSEDIDYEDFAFYMPSFLWVVRDFSLELVNKDGQKLTQKQYLEHALVEVKGFTEQIEAKNKIRRLVSAFFQDRDCCTLVRPVLEESALRNVEKLPQDQLRLEFVEEMLALRGQVLQGAKVKSLENAELTGEMFAELAGSYLKAFNEQQVPVIETCWTYICRAQCQKAFDSALDLYEREMESAFQHLWPMGKQALRNLSKDCQELATKEYRDTAVGECVEEYSKQLLEELKKKYSAIKSENAVQFEAQFKKMMEDLYAENVQPGLKERKYRSFVDFDRDFKSIENYFQELDVQGPNKQCLLQEFLLRKSSEAAYMLISGMEATFEEQLK